MTCRTHQPVALEVQKRRLQGRVQLLPCSKGQGLPGTVLERPLKGLLHPLQSGENESNLLLKGFLLGFLQLAGNREVILAS